MVPLFHVYGVNVTIANAISHGSTIVMPNSSFSAEESLKATIKEKCNAIYGTPTMFVDLVAKQRELQLPLEEIDFVNTAGAPISAKQVKDIKEVLNTKKVKSIYGLTEATSAIFHSLPDDESDTVLHSVGFVSDHLEVKVIDGYGNIVPFGEAGELCVRGYSTMLGYWDDEQKTKEVLGEDKWLKSGDQFILREDGYGMIVGRLKEMLIRGGENIFPKEIEDFLIHHPNILEVHVAGVPDERLGEEVAAFIRLKDTNKTLTVDDVKRFCKGQLSHFKIPRYVVIVDDFPRTLSGKIQKFKFLEMFGDKLNIKEPEKRG
jgi:fatty-acyl-CoA synthase